MTKFCKDCRHCMPQEIGNPKCAKVATPSTMYRVTGEGDEFEHVHCSTARIGATTMDNCGVDAGWFEPKLGEEAFRPAGIDERFSPGNIWTMREFDAAEKP